MHLRIAEQTNTRKLKNILLTFLIGAYAIISSIPHTALAFESALAISPAQKLVADVRITRTGSAARTQAVTAHASPVTVTAAQGRYISSRVAEHTVPRVYPTQDSPVVLEGEASFYSRAGCLGCDPQVIMANGQPLDDNALTMAIGADRKHLVGYRARVTSLATGKSVVVTITDTGGFYKAKYGHRVADLTIATKQAIGMAGGVGQVRVEVF